MRLVDTRGGAPNNRAAIRTDLVQPGPSTDMTHAFARAHPRVHPRPNFVHEERLAVIIEKMARRRIRWRIAGQDVGAFVMEVDAGSIDDHAVGGKIRGAIIDQANLPTNRFAVILQPKNPQ